MHAIPPESTITAEREALYSRFDEIAAIFAASGMALGEEERALLAPILTGAKSPQETLTELEALLAEASA